MMVRLAAALILCNVWPAVAHAQKAPDLGYVFPPAIRIGETTEVKLGGYDYTTDLQFFVHDKQIKLATDGVPGEFIVPPPPYWFGEKGRATAMRIPREISAQLSVEQGAQPGLARWQVANANGSSPCGMFYVSDLPELIESRWRTDPQILPTLEPNSPIGVSGRVERIAEVDRFLLKTKQSGPVTIELFARRLGSDFNGILEVWDGKGDRVADFADTLGRDGTLTYYSDASQTYELRLYDVDYRGNQAFVYRLELEQGPRVVATLPRSLAPGESRQVTFVGWGVATGKSQLESMQQQVQAPKGSTENGVWTYWLETKHGKSRVDFPFAAAPEANADNIRSPNGDGVEVQAPVRLTASFAGAQAIAPSDRYRIQLKKGESWRFDARSTSHDRELDLSLKVLDDELKQVAANDDLPNSSDAGLQFVAKKDGVFTCVVEELSGMPVALDSVYQLTITQPPPSFRLTAPQQVQLPIGGKASLKVTAIRESLAAEITLQVEGLPKGVTVPDSIVIPANKKDVTIAFDCAANVAAAASPIRIKAEAVFNKLDPTKPLASKKDAAKKKKDGKGKEEPAPELETLSRIVMATAAGNLAPRSDLDVELDAIMLTTTLKPQYSVMLTDKNRQRAVHRGTTYPAPFVIKREDGFAEEVRLMMAANQSRHRQGIWGPVLAVAPNQREALYPCHMPEWLETDRTTRMIVLGVANQKDPTGKVREVTQPADARITMILEGALLRISHESDELTVVRGTAFDVPFRLSRSSKLPLEAVVELVAPDEINDFLEGDRLVLSPKESAGIIQIRTKDESQLVGRWDFKLRATSMQDGRWPVVSETTVTAEFK